MKMGNSKETLLKFFTISCAGFEFAEIVSKSFGGQPDEKFYSMKHLHKITLEELEKDEPDMIVVGNFIHQMELLAESHLPKQ